MSTDMDAERQLRNGKCYPQTIEIDPKSARFPLCIVWTPLPVLSWLIPFIGHIGICREDGVILDFAGPNFVCVDSFAFGAVTRYLQIDAKVGTLSLDQTLHLSCTILYSFGKVRCNKKSYKSRHVSWTCTYPDETKHIVFLLLFVPADFPQSSYFQFLR